MMPSSLRKHDCIFFCSIKGGFIVDKGHRKSSEREGKRELERLREKGW